MKSNPLDDHHFKKYPCQPVPGIPFQQSERQARSVFPADYKKSAELVEFQIWDLWSPLFSTRSMVRDYAEQQNSSCCATAG